jgi:hypothetical protein
MHFGEEYDKAAAFAEYAGSKGCEFIGWRYRGESVDF